MQKQKAALCTLTSEMWEALSSFATLTHQHATGEAAKSLAHTARTLLAIACMHLSRGKKDKLHKEFVVRDKRGQHKQVVKAAFHILLLLENPLLIFVRDKFLECQRQFVIFRERHRNALLKSDPEFSRFSKCALDLPYLSTSRLHLQNPNLLQK